MPDLQEIISRARFAFAGAPKRQEIFDLVNGKGSTKDIARKTGRPLSSVLQDLEKLKDWELVREKEGNRGVLKKERATVFEKTPLIKHVSRSYFNEVSETSRFHKKKTGRPRKAARQTKTHTPTENEILDICKLGESQLHEFKGPETKMETISEEIAAFLHTKKGGILFYGIDDEGTILGSDLRRQDFDQRLHNSVRSTISPAPNVEIKERVVMGAAVMLVMIPPWDRKSLYQFTKKERYLIRKGQNKFGLQPEELKKLSRGEYVV